MGVDQIVHGPDGQIIEQIVDHGDGTATRTRWTDGTPQVEEITVPVPVPEPLPTAGVLEVLAAVDPDLLALAVGVGARVGMSAGELLDRLGDISATNTSRPWAERVTQIAVDAALAGQAPPTPET